MNIAINHIFAKQDPLGYIRRRQDESNFDWLDVIVSRATEFGQIMQKQPLRHSRSFKVTDFGIDRQPVCDLLLVNNTNLHPISYRFQVIADYWSNFRFGQGVSLF